MIPRTRILLGLIGDDRRALQNMADCAQTLQQVRAYNLRNGGQLASEINPDDLVEILEGCAAKGIYPSPDAEQVTMGLLAYAEGENAAGWPNLRADAVLGAHPAVRSAMRMS